MTMSIDSNNNNVEVSSTGFTHRGLPLWVARLASDPFRGYCFSLQPSMGWRELGPDGPEGAVCVLSWFGDGERFATVGEAVASLTDR